MHLEVVKVDADVCWVLPCHCQKQVLVVHQLGVIRIILPSCDLNSISWLSTEVFFDVVNDENFIEVAS